MKKVIFAALMLASVSSFANSNISVTSYSVASASGRDIPASQVPVAVRASFNAMFPDAKRVQWEIEMENGGIRYQAEFTSNGVRLKAEFLPDGTFVRVRRSNSGGGSGSGR